MIDWSALEMVRVAARAIFIMSLMVLILGIPLGDHGSTVVVLVGGISCAAWLSLSNAHLSQDD